MSISVIIPTLNEERNIGPLIRYLREDPAQDLIHEIIVVDGGSEDATSSLASLAGARVVLTDKRNRASQMNLGASDAKGRVFYFLHADTRPPRGFPQLIWEAYQEGYHSGCFRLRFDWSHWFLRVNCWFTRFNYNMLRFGDQSLFVERCVFKESDGFFSSMKVFEDQDIIKRLTQSTKFKVLPHYVTTSARKYRRNGPYRLQLAYFIVYLFYRLGFSQERLMKVYLSIVPHPRI